MTKRKPQPGEHAPWFKIRSDKNPRFVFDTVGGKASVLCFYGSLKNQQSVDILNMFKEHNQRVRSHCNFFAVSSDASDENSEAANMGDYGFYQFWDFDGRVSERYGLEVAAAGDQFQGHSFILDQRLRILSIVAFTDNPHQHVSSVLHALEIANAPTPKGVSEITAPVLVVPRIFEPDLCDRLIAYYDERGGQESGFMRELDGKTVAVHDHTHKRRADETIQDEELKMACMHRIVDRLIPEIQKAYNFHATRMERYLVACYKSEHGGHFRRHRDNTTGGTKHRKFAVSINLNPGEYEGGMLSFPEFGPRLYSPSKGGAVVFSCSMLHEAQPVTAGARYVFVPFLYTSPDDSDNTPAFDAYQPD
ncbi:MAG: 2OG-Fe(II) oxygenase [Kordiimonadaceae bacterium]|nr:2OG-Fe(II) oxygenase [Kordiimonadaceae bacterium]